MGRSKSSHQWLRKHFDDEYVKRAQREGYRSRAVYKLDEILTGNLVPLIEPLTMEYQADQLAALGGQEL